ncbi:MAG: hut operon positive regulator HutP [Synergistaceae bacterium]|jgi:hut operon positive regulator|nr:hut operon positive regulator HutP [Synergistaceae bacterium]
MKLRELFAVREVRQNSQQTSSPWEEAGQQENPIRGFELPIKLRFTEESQVGRAALLLSCTTDKKAEEELKALLNHEGWKAVATEVGGVASDLPQKITRALVGAALNAGVVDKNPREMHALMHAALEAINGFVSLGTLEASIGAKMAIVRNRNWIAVSMVGDTAYHAVAHHERCGLGVMHI